MSTDDFAVGVDADKIDQAPMMLSSCFLRILEEL